MREIKGFVRVNVVDRVVQALEAAGIANITIIDVRAIWTSLRGGPRDLHYSMKFAERYMNVAKIETLVRDGDVEQVIDIIRTAARTGRPGDGVVYAVPAESVVHIRTGRRDDAAIG
jgi:nitrogen regulatory protein P-II 1